MIAAILLGLKSVFSAIVAFCAAVIAWIFKHPLETIIIVLGIALAWFIWDGKRKLAACQKKAAAEAKIAAGSLASMTSERNKLALDLVQQNKAILDLKTASDKLKGDLATAAGRATGAEATARKLADALLANRKDIPKTCEGATSWLRQYNLTVGKKKAVHP